VAAPNCLPNIERSHAWEEELKVMSFIVCSWTPRCSASTCSLRSTNPLLNSTYFLVRERSSVAFASTPWILLTHKTLYCMKNTLQEAAPRVTFIHAIYRWDRLAVYYYYCYYCHHHHHYYHHYKACVPNNNNNNNKRQTRPYDLFQSHRSPTKPSLQLSHLTSLYPHQLIKSWTVELLSLFMWVTSSNVYYYYYYYINGWGTRWRRWLRNCIKCRNVAGSIPMVSSFRQYCGPGVYSASNRNECQKYFLGGGWGLKTARA